MFVPVYRLAGGLGRVAIQSGLKLGAALGQPGRTTPGRMGARRRAFQLTLTPRQLPALALLLLANAAVVVGATLVIERLTLPSAVAVLPAVTAPLTPPAR